MLSSIFGNKEARILVLGLDNAGKTTILYRLQMGEVVSTIPTIGFNVETVQYNNVKFQVWDLDRRQESTRWKNIGKHLVNIVSLGFGTEFFVTPDSSLLIEAYNVKKGTRNKATFQQKVPHATVNSRILPLSYETWSKIPKTTKEEAFSVIKEASNEGEKIGDVDFFETTHTGKDGKFRDDVAADIVKDARKKIEEMSSSSSADPLTL